MRKKELRKRIEELEQQVEALRERNGELYERLIEAGNSPNLARVAQPTTQARVYYMDDQRMLELQEHGDAPT